MEDDPIIDTQPNVIVFEGLDAAGKTTQIRLLAHSLNERGFTVNKTGVFLTPHGRDVRAWFMDTERVSRASHRSQLFLLGSAMSEVLDEVKSSAASVILIDRFVYTTMAYHGGGLQLGIADVEEVYAPILRRFRPDLVVILDLPPTMIAARKAASDRIEENDRQFYERVREVYENIALTLPNAVKIDAIPTAMAVHREILQLVLNYLPQQAIG
jgi:dTMP kinase